MAPRFSASGSFAGVYGISEIVAGVIDETANYAGAVMLFQQTSAPTGWTKSTTDDDAILTVTSGSLTTGGSLGFTSVFNSTLSVTGAVTLGSMTVGSTTITNVMIPAHGHSYTGNSTVATRDNPATSNYRAGTTTPMPPGAYPVASGYTGPTGHTHPNPPLNSGSTTYFSKAFDLKYVDVIIATKD